MLKCYTSSLQGHVGGAASLIAAAPIRLPVKISAPPLRCRIAADLGVAGGGPLDQHPPKQRPAAHLTVEDTTRVVRPPREAMAKPTGWAAAATERVGALRPGDFAPRRVPVAPSGGADGGETTAGEVTKFSLRCLNGSPFCGDNVLKKLLLVTIIDL